MSSADRLAARIHEGEQDWISRVVDHLADDELKLVYADWLDERGDERSKFLRDFVAASASMRFDDFPAADGQPEEWLELIGYRLLSKIAEHGAAELKEPVLRLARPALRMTLVAADENDIPVGASKIGGHPDLPTHVPWPIGNDCAAIYNDDTSGVEELAGFLAQINLADLARTQAGRVMPQAGVLSFFCFQDVENDNPDVIGARAILLPDAASLVRTDPPRDFIEGNELMDSHVLLFEETLDLPEAYDGPWSDELKPDPSKDYREVLDHFRSLNFDNVLGYGRATTGSDPTPNQQSRHLIILSNSVECRLHIQIDEKDLTTRNFDAIKLEWVDFD